jgi:hypothetical protein
MTEADWLGGKDPEAMLALVGERLSPRQWHLLACAAARRAWETIPEGDLREAVAWCEANAGQVKGNRGRAKVVKKVEAARPLAPDAARAAQHAIVRTADPDADPESFEHTGARKTNAAVPLFQAASRYANVSVGQAEEAAAHAAGFAPVRLEMAPGPEQLAAVRQLVVEATRVRTAASLHAAAALKLKAAGDAAADEDQTRNNNVRYAAALEKVTKEEEALATKVGDLEEAKQRADRKAVARYLLDIAGNPFKPYRIEGGWRTDTVTGLAGTIDEIRAFDRLPILADALLDADCDEEAVLRHCRGTEAHTPDGPAHTRGCWVVELILQREKAFFAAPPLVPPPPPPPPPARAPGSPSRPSNAGWGRLLQALEDADDDDAPPTA